MSAQQRVTIKIPKTLYAQIGEIIRDTGFSSVTEFIVYVLRDVISLKAGTPSESLTPAEIDAIRDKLRNLGYI